MLLTREQAQIVVREFRKRMAGWDTMTEALQRVDLPDSPRVAALVQAARKVPICIVKDTDDPSYTPGTWLTCKGCGSHGPLKCDDDCWASRLESALAAFDEGASRAE